MTEAVGTGAELGLAPRGVLHRAAVPRQAPASTGRSAVGGPCDLPLWFPEKTAGGRDEPHKGRGSVSASSRSGCRTAGRLVFPAWPGCAAAAEAPPVARGRAGAGAAPDTQSSFHSTLLLVSRFLQKIGPTDVTQAAGQSPRTTVSAALSSHNFFKKRLFCSYR